MRENGLWHETSAAKTESPCFPDVYLSNGIYTVKATVMRGINGISEIDAILSQMDSGAYVLPVFQRGYALQDKRHDYGKIPDEVGVILREIDAQNYLLSVAEKYKIPAEETAETLANLEEYKRQLEEIKGRGL